MIPFLLRLSLNLGFKEPRAIINYANTAPKITHNLRNEIDYFTLVIFFRQGSLLNTNPSNRLP